MYGRSNTTAQTFAELEFSLGVRENCQKNHTCQTLTFGGEVTSHPGH